MKAFLAAIILIGFGVFGMCFNIIFRKNGEFPEYEVGENKKMRELGIKCMHELEKELFAENNKKKHSHCTGNFTADCKGCGFYSQENN